MFKLISFQKYSGNKDQSTLVITDLVQPVKAQFIRILPEEWHGHISMRMELYGCDSSKEKTSLLILLLLLTCIIIKPLSNYLSFRLVHWSSSGIKLVCSCLGSPSLSRSTKLLFTLCFKSFLLLSKIPFPLALLHNLCP